MSGVKLTGIAMASQSTGTGAASLSPDIRRPFAWRMVTGA